MKKTIFPVLLLVALGPMLLAQDTYSKIFDLYGSTLEYGNSSDIIFRLVDSEEGLFAGIGNRCNDFTVDCAVLAELSLAGDTLWTKVIDWLDPGARGLDKKGDTLIMAGHNAPSLENFYLYYMTLSGDSILAVDLFPPEGYYEVRIGGVHQYGPYSIVYGTAREEGQSGFVSLAHWVTANGIIDTTMIFDDGDISDNIYDMDVDSEGNVVFLIDKEDIVPGPYPYEIVRKNILKFNTQKELIWEWETDNEYDFSGNVVGRIKTISDGIMVINAEDNSQFREEIWNLDEDGIIWKYKYPLSNSVHYKIMNFAEATNGDIIGTGEIRDFSINNGRMGYLFRMTKGGEMLWERALIDTKNEVPDIVINSKLRDVVELEDGTILVGGWIDTWFYNNDNEETKGIDAWLIRTDANGCIIEDCDYVQDLTVTSIPIFSDPVHIDFFPNPTSDHLTISWPEEFPISEIQVYDPLGQLLLRKYQPATYEQLDLSGLAPGLYSVLLIDQRSRGYSKKVLVLR